MVAAPLALLLPTSMAAHAWCGGSPATTLRPRLTLHSPLQIAEYPQQTRGRFGVSRCCAVTEKKDSSIDALAGRAAEAISKGRAHVEPGFLSGHALEVSRADMMSVLADEFDELESIQTDLLDPEFQQSLPSLPFGGLLETLAELRVALARRTGRPLSERGGLHLMRYPVGSKFMRHADEDPSLDEPVRNSISFLIYLTPTDWSAEDGGALRVYEGEGGCEPRNVLPAGGTLVVYDSTVEHEVLPTRRQRHLISGRFRELDETWQLRLQ